MGKTLKDKDIQRLGRALDAFERRGVGSGSQPPRDPRQGSKELESKVIGPSDPNDPSNPAFDCCDCTLAPLFLSISNPGIQWKLVGRSKVSGGSITHTIRLTCNGSNRTITLVALSCSALACQTLDMSGEYVGTCEIGVVSYGNDPSCASGVGSASCAMNLPPYTASGTHALTFGGSSFSDSLGLGPQYDTSYLNAEMTIEIGAPGGNDVTAESVLLFVAGGTGRQHIVQVNHVRSVLQDHIRVYVYNVANVGLGQPVYEIPFDEDPHTLRVVESSAGYDAFFDGVLVWGIAGRSPCLGRLDGFTGDLFGDADDTLDISYTGGFY